jgi:hypothetical protein
MSLLRNQFEHVRLFPQGVHTAYAVSDVVAVGHIPNLSRSRTDFGRLAGASAATEIVNSVCWTLRFPAWPVGKPCGNSGKMHPPGK